MKNHGRGILVALVTAMAITSVGLCTPAQASAPVPTAKVIRVAAAQAAPKPKPGRLGEVSAAANVDAQWTGWLVKFSKTETVAIGAGAGTCSLIVGKLPYYISKVISVLCGLMAIYASALRGTGNCMAIWVPYTAPITPVQFRYWNC